MASGGAMRPSSVMATFISTKGRLCWIQRAKPSLMRRASVSQTPMFVSNAGGAQCFHAVAGDVGIGIAGGGDDACDSGGDEGFGAGAGAAGVIAGFEGDVGGAALETISLSCYCWLFEGGDFGVVEEVVFVPAFADELAGAVEDDAADGGIGRGEADAAAGEFESALHPVGVLSGVFMCGRRVQIAALRSVTAEPNPMWVKEVQWATLRTSVDECPELESRSFAYHQELKTLRPGSG